MRPTVFYRRRGGGWRVRVQQGGTRIDRGGFGHDDAAREAAEAFAAELEAAWAAARRDADRTAAAGRPLPVDELVRDWLLTYGALRSERTRITDQGRVGHLARYFGGLDARALTLARVTAFASSITDSGRSSWVAIGCLSVLRRALNLAVKAGALEAHPVPELGDVIRQVRERGRSEVRRPDAWSKAEAAALVGVARRHAPEIAGALRFAFGTGARRGELLALRWEDVDFRGARVEIRRTVKPRGGTKAPKSGRSRWTPLAPELVRLLAELLDRQTAATLEGLPEPEWVFRTPTGKAWQESNFSDHFRRVRRRALREAGVRPLPLHATRHSFITWALEAAVPVKRVSEWVGASVAVIERHYAHVLPREATDLGFVALDDSGGFEGSGRAAGGGRGASGRSRSLRSRG